MSFDTQQMGKAVNELLVLGALRSGPMHGYQIALEVEARSAGLFELQHGTLYPILHRLERDGLIAGSWESETGRRRKQYRLTRTGRSHVGEEGARVTDALRELLSMLGIDDDALRARPSEG